MVASPTAKKDVIVAAATRNLATFAPGQERAIALTTRGRWVRGIGVRCHRLKMARRHHSLPDDRQQDLVGIRVKDSIPLRRVIRRWHEQALLIRARPANRQLHAHRLVFKVALRAALAPRPDQLSPCPGLSHLTQIP